MNVKNWEKRRRPSRKWSTNFLLWVEMETKAVSSHNTQGEEVLPGLERSFFNTFTINNGCDDEEVKLIFDGTIYFSDENSVRAYKQYLCRSMDICTVRCKVE